MSRSLSIAAWYTACFLCGCTEGAPEEPSTVDPEFGDPCAYQSCSDHGLCVVDDDAPMCLCEPGYGDARCGSCERDFHIDALDRCAPDRSCAEQETNPCGDHGACDDSSGVITCDCDVGYEGPRCTLCASGWDRNAFDECLQVVLGPMGVVDDPDDPGASGRSGGPRDGGTGDDGPETCSVSACNGRGTCEDSSGDVACTCQAGYGGALCDACASGHHRDGTQQCVPDESCSSTTCGEHGDCDDGSGTIACACDAGYVGDACDACAPGFHDDDDACVADTTCLGTTCDGRGTCSASSGTTTCVCQAGYAGSHCTTCATGYHRGAGDACVLDEVCTSSACGPHGNCTLDDGEIECQCDAGHAGDACAVCAPGFHADGDDCKLDQQCQPTSCPEHASCDDDSGTVSCTCARGYAGTLCDACAPGYYRFFAAGTCIVYDCDANPLDAPGGETFESFGGFPSSNNTCLSDVDVTSFELTPSSIDDDGIVWACAPSTLYDFETRHVLLEAGTLGAAALRFAGPISALSFDYAAQTALSLDLSADGVSQTTITGPRWSSGSVSLTFSAPVSLIELHSLSAFTNQIALDDITFTPPDCD